MQDRPLIESIVSRLKSGGVIALPTETIYGLCCDPRQPRAVERLFSIKQREASKAVICVTGDRVHIDRLADVPPSIEPLLSQAWPGPLTVIFPLKTSMFLPAPVTKDKTIGLRLSPDPLIRAVTSALDFPMIASSANISGQPFLCSADEVRAQFGNLLDLIIETDHPLLQTPSTIIQCDPQGKISLIREGAMAWKELKIKSAESQPD